MFNPYSVRPIGSKKYEDHLLDVFSSMHYRWQLPEEPLKLPIHGEHIWKNGEDEDPWESLCIAVTVQAIVDYIDYFRRWREAQHQCNDGREVYYHSKMLELENDFFRTNEAVEHAFDEPLKLLIFQDHDSIKKSAQWLSGSIIRNYFHYKHEREG